MDADGRRFSRAMTVPVEVFICVYRRLSAANPDFQLGSS
jgi:hypothetical protein